VFTVVSLSSLLLVKRCTILKEIYKEVSPIKPQSPCFNCDERCLKCHSVCNRYGRYKQALQEWSQKERDEKVYSCYMADHYYRIAPRN
jgi:hypothetical protein